MIKDGRLVLLKWRKRRFALRFAFRVKPRDRFVFQNVKVAPTSKGGDGLGVRGHPADCQPRSLYKGQNCINIKCLLFLSIPHMLPSSLVVISFCVIHDVHGLHKQKLQRDHKATCVEWKEVRIQRAITRVRKRRRDKAGDLNLNPSPPAPREHNPPPPPPSHCLAAH